MDVRPERPKSPRRAARPLLPAALLVAGALVALPAARAAGESEGEEASGPVQAERIEAGQPAPDFALEDLEGDSHRLSEHDGPLVLVFFRGAW